MKKLLFTLILAMGMIISISAKTNIIAEGKTHTAMGDYQIVNVDENFIINYQNSPMAVEIAVSKVGKKTIYTVTTENVSVKYVQANRSFGIGDVINAENLNKEAYYHQKVLTNGQSMKSSLGLIAAYFPYLLLEV